MASSEPDIKRGGLGRPTPPPPPAASRPVGGKVGEVPDSRPRARLTVAPTLLRATPPPGAAPGIATSQLDRAAAAHKIPEITVRVRRMPGGFLRFQPLQAPGYVTVARRPFELPTALGRCFTEAEIHANALWKGQRPELADLEPDDEHTGPRVVPPLPPRRHGRDGQPWRGGGSEREQHPSVWQPNADGTAFTSSRSKRTITDPTMVARIRRRRALVGLPVCADPAATPTPEQDDTDAHVATLTAAAAEHDTTPKALLTRIASAALDAVTHRPGYGCATTDGYRRHLTAEQRPCDACWMAHRISQGRTPDLMLREDDHDDPRPVGVLPPVAKRHRRCPGPSQLTFDGLAPHETPKASDLLTRPLRVLEAAG